MQCLQTLQTETSDKLFQSTTLLLAPTFPNLSEAFLPEELS